MTTGPTVHPAFVLGVRDGITKQAAVRRADTAPQARVLVPVDVQALLVRPAGPNIGADRVPVADIATRVLDGADPASASPPPFRDAPDRPPGVHLHWAMPDGLTAGTADGTYRPLPNRWLIARLSGGGFPRPVRCWVVESDRCRSDELDQWTEPGPVGPGAAPPHVPAAALTAVTGGEPAWVAVYDNVARRFGFHDEWQPGQVPADPLTYVVVGWYSQPELDPLAGDGDPSALLTALGWSVDPDRMAAAAQEGAVAGRAAAATGAVPASVLPPGRAARLTGLVDADAIVDADPQPRWPRQTVYHGVVYGVQYKVKRAEPLPDPMPKPSSVDVAVGATAVDATAGLLAARVQSAGGGPPLDTAEVQYSAFGYGMTGALADPSGVARLDEEFHARAFDSAPGGERAENVFTGDPFIEMRDPVRPTPAVDALRARHPAGPARPVRLAFVGSGGDVTDLLTVRTQPELVAPPPEPRRVEPRTVPLPRFFAPQDPVVLLGNLHRSLRHGYDGRFTSEDRLRCRLTGDPVSTIAGADARVLIASVPAHGAMPRDAGDLVVEAAAEDPFVDYDEQLSGKIGIDPSLVQGSMRAERLLYLQWLSRPDEVAPLTQYSFKNGVAGSPAGVTIWRQPWVPMYAEWDLETHLSTDLTGWDLRELDFAPAAGLRPNPVRGFRGRTLLTPGSTKALTSAIAAACAAEDELDRAGQGQLDDADQADLRRLAGQTGFPDFLAACLGDLRSHLLGYEHGVTVNGTAPSPHREALLLRAGHAWLRRLRVVDAFSRYLTLIDAAAPPHGNLVPVVARGLRGEPVPHDARPPIILAPRLNQQARLLFRLLDAADDTVEANVDQSRSAAPSPVAGWLLADHADDAIEFFDPAGEPLGQLRHDPLTGALGWEGPPGDRGPLGARPGWPSPALRHLAGLTTGLLAADAAERAAGAPHQDSPLRALLRVIDTVAETIGGTGHTEHLAQLVGRPVALVRAQLRLDIMAEPAFAELSPDEMESRKAAWQRLAATAFPVRLGALTRLDDGLYGYFVEDDYQRLYPIHESVPQQAVDTGARKGDLAALASTAAPRPIDAPLVVTGPRVLWIRPGQTIRLTMLQDAGAKVHATSGLLPRKSIELLRDWTAAALARLLPSFRVGPVLVDPQDVRMPITTLLSETQSWSRRVAESTWKDDPIVAATQQALLPSDAAVLEEGYLRLRMDEQR